MNDHLENIYDAMRRDTEYVRVILDNGEDEDGDTFDAFLLDITTMSPDGERFRTELLLTYGGPTVWVVVDSYRGVEYHHSWGKDDDGRPCDRINMFGKEERTWREVAEYVTGEDHTS